jgi:hypothetical protein
MRRIRSRVAPLSAVLSLLAAASLYAEPPDKAAVEKAILADETAINEAVARRDVAGFQKHIAAGAWTIDQTGLMPVADFVKAIDQVSFEPGWKIDASRVLWIDDNALVHFYHWAGKGSFAGHAFGDSFASTVWAKRGGVWLALVHHETPAAPPTAGPSR